MYELTAKLCDGL